MAKEIKDAIARFIISQVIECPHCYKEFDVIATIRSGRCQSQTMTVKQSIHEKADALTPTKEITVNIPRPSYFGALMQYTKFPEGNEELIDCPLCGGHIRVPEVDFDYQILISQDKSNKFTRAMRRLFPRRSHPELCMNHDL